MKKYFDYSGQEYDGCEVCEITAKDLSKANAEWKKFQSKKGELYKLEPEKDPRFSRFCAIFFGLEPEPDMFAFTNFPYTLPHKIICTNKNIAQQAYEFLRPLAYHNTFNQTYCDIALEKNIIKIYGGDY